MKHKGIRPSQIHRGKLLLERPGLASPMIIPVKLRNQLDPKAEATPLLIERTGKTTVGSPQYRLAARPGLARPLIVAKQDAQKPAREMEKAEGASEVVEPMKPKANAQKAQAAEKAAAPAQAKAQGKPLNGLRGYYRW